MCPSRQEPEVLQSGTALWIYALVLVALAVTAAALWRLGSRFDGRFELTVAAAAATVGVYACVPETDLVRMMHRCR